MLGNKSPAFAGLFHKETHMKYETIISTERLRPTTTVREHDLTSETESDKARVLFSAPFRRLQKKAQVFPLESNAAVRSRLTHSLEVAAVGRQIAQKIAKELVNQTEISDSDPLVNIVECACLLHDIGNPPFGHFGEAAISSWFKNKGAESKPFERHRINFTPYYLDFENFDGNAQGLRIITKLQGEDQYGLNLTCSTIAAYLKYPHSESTREAGKNNFHKKPGYFLTEDDSMKATWDKLKIPHHVRSPLTFIMEAADDIAYCLSDIEDGIEKNIITLEQVLMEIEYALDSDARSQWQEMVAKAEEHKNTINKFIYIRTNLINKATDIAKESFIENSSAIFSGDFHETLITKSSFEYKVLKAARSFVALKVYTSREAEVIELSGNSIITGLLDKLAPLLEINTDCFQIILNKDTDGIKENGLQIHSRLINLLPSQCKKSYKHEANQKPEMEWIYRVHLIIDYLSGMTDDFALEMYQKLMGIRTT
jgi:dGTPase